MTNPTKPRRRFTAQQKQEAVELCLTEGLTCTAVAQRLGLPNSSLAKWVQQARIDQGQHGSRVQGLLTSEERAELSRLRKEIRELRREKDFSGLRQRTTASGPLGYASSMQRAAAFEMVCLISLVLDCFSVAWLCMQLGVVGRSGFYGAPRVHQELRASGLQLGRHRIARLMSCTAFMAKTRRGFRPCRHPGNRANGVAENLQQQEFSPAAPNRC